MAIIFPVKLYEDRWNNKQYNKVAIEIFSYSLSKLTHSSCWLWRETSVKFENMKLSRLTWWWCTEVIQVADTCPLVHWGAMNSWGQMCKDWGSWEILAGHFHPGPQIWMLHSPATPAHIYLHIHFWTDRIQLWGCGLLCMDTRMTSYNA